MNLSSYLPALGLVIGATAASLNKGKSPSKNLRLVELIIHGGTPNVASSSARVINLPATSTDQTVHGICVKGSPSPSASSSYDGLTYESVSFTGAPVAWGDRSYILTGVDTVTKCSDGIFLKPSLHKEIPSGTEISITTESGSTVCVFFEKDMNSPDTGYIRNGGWLDSMNDSTGWSAESYPNFGFFEYPYVHVFETRCIEIAEMVNPTPLPTSLPTVKPTPLPTAEMVNPTPLPTSLPTVKPTPFPVAPAALVCHDWEQCQSCSNGGDPVCGGIMDLDDCKAWCNVQGVGCCGMLKNYSSGYLLNVGLCTWIAGDEGSHNTTAVGKFSAQCTMEGGGDLKRDQVIEIE